MAIEVVTKITRKGTVRTIAYVHNDAGTLTNATSAAVTQRDPNNTLVTNAVGMNCLAAGTYEHCLYTNVNSNTGLWRGEVDVTDGSSPTDKHSFAHYGFELLAGI